MEKYAGGRTFTGGLKPVIPDTYSLKKKNVYVHKTDGISTPKSNPFIRYLKTFTPFGGISGSRVHLLTQFLLNIIEQNITLSHKYISITYKNSKKYVICR